MKEIAAKNLMGLPVYSIREGETFGFVRHLVIDPNDKTLLAVVIDRKGWSQDTKIIPATKIAEIGNDAVTIGDKNQLTRVANLPRMVQYLHQPDHILGNRVISENGRLLGKAAEYYLNTESGQISRLDISVNRTHPHSGKQSVNGRYILTIGPSAIVLAKEALEQLRPLSSPHPEDRRKNKNKTEKIAKKSISVSQKISRVLTEKFRDFPQKITDAIPSSLRNEPDIDRELQSLLRERTEKEIVSSESAADHPPSLSTLPQKEELS